MSSPNPLMNSAINSTNLSFVNTTEVNTTKADPRDENLAVIEIGVQVAIIILTVIGNSVVMLTLKLRKKRLSRMHLMIGHLSLADLFVAFFNTLPQLAWDVTYRFKGGDLLCRLVKYFQIVAMYASSYVLLTTAIDRFYAICRPLTSARWTSGRVHRLVITAWVISLLFGLPQIALFSYREITPDTGIYDCWDMFEPEWKLQLYITWITVSVYIIPTIILAIAYGCICYSVWKSSKIAEKMTPALSLQSARLTNTTASTHDGGALLKDGSKAHVKHPDHGISRAKIKTIKLTMTVIICYLICWSPFFIAQMWAAFDPYAPFYGPTYTIILLLASLNSCTNPWIYMVFSDAVCTELKRMFIPRKIREARDGNITGCLCSSLCIGDHQSSRVHTRNRKYDYDRGYTSCNTEMSLA